MIRFLEREAREGKGAGLAEISTKLFKLPGFLTKNYQNISKIFLSRN